MPKSHNGVAAAVAAAFMTFGCGLPQSETVRSTIKDYYHLTDEIAHGLDERMGQDPEYQIVRIVGADYEVGSILAGKVGADRLTRRCVARKDLIGVSPFADFPSITAGRVMKFSAGTDKSPISTEVLHRLAAVGITVHDGEELSYSIGDMHQELVDRADLAELVDGNPYVDGPLLARLTDSFLDRLACIHMSGLLDAVAHDRWPRWFPRREFHTD